MENKKNFYIDGKWQEPQSKKEIKVINPATEENSALITLGNKDKKMSCSLYFMWARRVLHLQKSKES